MYYTKPLVKTILEHPLQYKWSLQGLGMLRLYLTDDVRLHVWDDRYRMPNVTPLHTHPWDFISTVVAGVVTNIRYKYADAHFKAYSRFGINCGARAEAKSWDIVHLKKLEPEYWREGDSYFERYDEIHESRPLNGTVTLVKRVFREDRESAYVFGESWKPFVSAEPREADKSEVLDITQNALDRWFLEAAKPLPNKSQTAWGILENWESRG